MVSGVKRCAFPTPPPSRTPPPLAHPPPRTPPLSQPPPPTHKNLNLGGDGCRVEVQLQNLPCGRRSNNASPLRPFNNFSPWRQAWPLCVWSSSCCPRRDPSPTRTPEKPSYFSRFLFQIKRKKLKICKKGSTILNQQIYQNVKKRQTGLLYIFSIPSVSSG
jgi:hypothetical protein